MRQSTDVFHGTAFTRGHLTFIFELSQKNIQPPNKFTKKCMKKKILNHCIHFKPPP